MDGWMDGWMDVSMHVPMYVPMLVHLSTHVCDACNVGRCIVCTYLYFMYVRMHVCIYDSSTESKSPLRRSFVHTWFETVLRTDVHSIRAAEELGRMLSFTSGS